MNVQQVVHALHRTQLQEVADWARPYAGRLDGARPALAAVLRALAEVCDAEQSRREGLGGDTYGRAEELRLALLRLDSRELGWLGLAAALTATAGPVLALWAAVLGTAAAARSTAAADASAFAELVAAFEDDGAAGGLVPGGDLAAYLRGLAGG